MSEIAEIKLLKARLAELEDVVKDIDSGRTKTEEKFRDKVALALLTGFGGYILSEDDMREQANAAYRFADIIMEEKVKPKDVTIK